MKRSYLQRQFLLSSLAPANVLPGCFGPSVNDNHQPTQDTSCYPVEGFAGVLIGQELSLQVFSLNQETERRIKKNHL